VRRAPIRLRLTAWYVVVLALIIAALSAFVVTRLRSDLTSEVDRALRSAAAQIGQGYGAEGAAEFRDVARTVLPGPVGGESAAQILEPAGRVLHVEGSLVARSPLIERAALTRALGGEAVLATRQVGSPAQSLRTFAVPVRRSGRRQVLVVAESLGEVNSAVDRALLLLVIGGTGGLVLAAIGGWWIARKALRPVQVMTTRADSIGVADLSQRLAVPRTHDEVGHLARTLNAMLARLEEGVETRERLVADASHELRGPLAAMRSELEVSLRHDPLGGAARTVLTSARDEVVRMGRIVDNLLTLARVDEGRLELLVAPHDLRALAERAVRTHRAAAAGAGVELVVEGGPLVAEVDPDRFEQVIGNLVDNAIRHSPRGGTVRVRLSDGGSEAGIDVCDEGPGVPAEARERIFERFARQEAARGRDGGAGLGLAICREIVRAHGGRIWVRDRDPRGSAFCITLPSTDLARVSPPRAERSCGEA
jgi:heavy metal sensor kinase